MSCVTCAHNRIALNTIARKLNKRLARGLPVDTKSMSEIGDLKRKLREHANLDHPGGNGGVRNYV